MNSTQAPTDVTITGGTICLIKGGWIYTATRCIYGWEQAADGKWQTEYSQKMGTDNPVYYTTADLTGIYENNTLVEKAEY